MSAIRAVNGTFLSVRKTHCVRGHAFTPENTKIRASGAQTCRECMRIRKKSRRKTTRSETDRRHARKVSQRRRQIAREFVIEMKSRPCMDCGGTFHHVAMDFDHRENEKKHREISAMSGASVARLRIEMAKCDVVCSNCHRLRTFMRIQRGRGALE